jgi:hypothetical protein
VAKTHSSIATDSAAELNGLVGDDATATFENDPKFVDSNPGGAGSSENVEEQRAEDDVEDSDEEVDDADDEDLDEEADDEDVDDEDLDDEDLDDDDAAEEEDDEEDEADEVGTTATANK